MQDILYWSEIVIAALLILFILLQQKSAGLGAAMGGGGEHFASKRGLDRLLSAGTMILALLFFGNAIAYLFV